MFCKITPLPALYTNGLHAVGSFLARSCRSAILRRLRHNSGTTSLGNGGRTRPLRSQLHMVHSCYWSFYISTSSIPNTHHPNYCPKNAIIINFWSRYHGFSGFRSVAGFLYTWAALRKWPFSCALEAKAKTKPKLTPRQPGGVTHVRKLRPN